MVSRPDDSESMEALSTESEATTGREALAWAIRHFGIDPESKERQRTVENLQRWLIGQGVRIPTDGIFGRATLNALERVYMPGLKYIAPDLTPEEPRRKRSKRKGAARPAASGQNQSLPETGPGPTAQPTAGSTVPEDSGTSARPVALSDSAIDDPSRDRLNFGPYVKAVADFILAEQTKPPLAIAINAPWGHGKTSFMNMLDAQLKADAPGTSLRIATTWFNPWKYNEPQQVWAAFVANVTSCLRKHLTIGQTSGFLLRRLGTKLHRHRWDVSFWLRMVVAALFLSLVGCLAFLDLEELRKAILMQQGLLEAYEKIPEDQSANALWSAAAWLSIILAVLVAYVGVANKLGLNLLQYVEKTDFKDKIGTLSQFGHEMEKLREAVPHDLKVVVFIDDLDRCSGKILGELIEALQLAEVSRTCIFIMAMDMEIVAKAIEKERSELAQSTGSVARMEHGKGYKFLEKIIQARLTLPAHDADKMKLLIKDAMPNEERTEGSDLPEQTPSDGEASQDSGLPGKPLSNEPPQPSPQPETTVIGRIRRVLKYLAGEQRQVPSDSDAVIKTATHYGSHHFSNPRRLKRFINGFRLQTYVISAVAQNGDGENLPSLDRLARFLVLAEKWPAVLAYMREHDLGSADLLQEKATGPTPTMGDEIKRLRKEDRDRLEELLEGRDHRDPLRAGEWKALADAYGFGHYGAADT